MLYSYKIDQYQNYYQKSFVMTVEISEMRFFFAFYEIQDEGTYAICCFKWFM